MTTQDDFCKTLYVLYVACSSLRVDIPAAELRWTCTYERNVMSADPPDSRGIGWAWKCLSMSVTVWNHKWWTWHWPFSLTDKRKCCREQSVRERERMNRERWQGKEKILKSVKKQKKGKKMGQLMHRNPDRGHYLKKRLVAGEEWQHPEADTRGNDGSWHFLSKADWQDVMAWDHVT